MKNVPTAGVDVSKHFSDMCILLSAIQRLFFYTASGHGKIPQNFKSRVVLLPDRILFNDYPLFYKLLSEGFDIRKVWTLFFPFRAYEAYEVRSLTDLLYLELFHMILGNVAVKNCEWCGKHFVLKGDYVNKYCDRVPKGKKQTCQQLGSSRDFQRLVKKSEASRRYMRAYKRMHSRIKYGIITKEDLKSGTWQQATGCGNAKREKCRRTN